LARIASRSFCIRVAIGFRAITSDLPERRRTRSRRHVPRTRGSHLRTISKIYSGGHPDIERTASAFLRPIGSLGARGAKSLPSIKRRSGAAARQEKEDSRLRPVGGSASTRRALRLARSRVSKKGGSLPASLMRYNIQWTVQTVLNGGSRESPLSRGTERCQSTNSGISFESVT
jgi:hypothetical protein